MKKHVSVLLVLMLLVTAVSLIGTSASASEKTTQIYKFTFEDENAGTVLRTQAGDFVGEIVEWPEDSGNHCLRYELNETTHRGVGVQPSIWPVGIEDALLAQKDLVDSGSALQLKVEYAYSGTIDPSHKPYMYPFILFNDTEENYADHNTYAPGSNEFNPGTFTWSEWDYGSPEEGLKNGGITFIDESTLSNGNYMYVDNIELAWVGEWTDVENALITYDNGTPCEESDINVIPDPTATGTKTTATEIEPTATEAEPTATEAEPTSTATETATEAEPTSTATETEPTSTATTTVTEPIVTETQPVETIVYGDANGDGVVNMKDVLTIRKYVAGITVDIDLVSADTNGDGVVNMKDVLTIRKYVANIISVIDGGKTTPTDPTEVCYPENAPLLKTILHGANGVDVTEEENVYDENKRLISHISRWVDDEGGIGSRTEKLVYDEQGNQTFVYYLDENGEWILSEENHYENSVLVYSRSHIIGLESYYESDYDENGNEIQVFEHGEDGLQYNWWQSTYNEDGNVVFSQAFMPDGRKADHYVEYSYDEQKNCISSMVYRNGEIFWLDSWTSEFDKDGNKIRDVYYDDGAVCWYYIYTYDENGNPLSKHSFDGDGNEHPWYEYTYDANGNQLNERYCNIDGSSYVTEEYTYDGNGNMTSEQSNGPFGNVFFRIEYSYDKNGNLLTQTRYDEDGSVWSYEYIYLS